MVTLLTGGGLQSAVVEAVDVTFFDNSGACQGAGFTFNGLAERTCAVVSNEGSVQIRDLDSKRRVWGTEMGDARLRSSPERDQLFGASLAAVLPALPGSSAAPS
ncbi:unnamed protein product [Sphagnum balticum]